MANTGHLKYQKEIFHVSDDMTRMVTDKFNISEKALEDIFRLIKEWYKMQPHLPDIALEDRYILRLLNLNKFSVEKTKYKMDNLYTARTMIPEFFGNRDPWSPTIAKSLKDYEWVFLPQLTPEKYRVQITRNINPDPDCFIPSNMYTLGFMIADMRLSLDIMHGDILVWDFDNTTVQHAAKVGPSFIKKSWFVIQNCYGGIIKGIHILNLPSYAEICINIMKSLASKKMSERIHVHSCVEDLYKFIPRSILPKDMGGDEPKTREEMADDLRKAISSPEWREWYVESMKIKSDESRRPVKLDITFDDTIGVSGTFRKLDID